MGAEPYTVHLSDEVLEDLQRRLVNARLPQDFANDDWGYGVNGAYLRELVDYWIEGYDWRAVEREINAFANYRTEIEGVPIHFIHERGKGPDPKPLILSHGWPWCFWDFHELIGPLTDPAAHGATSATPSTWCCPRCRASDSRRRTASPASTSGARPTCGRS